MEGCVNEKPVKSEDEGLDVIGLFRGLEPEQAQQLAKRIKETLPHLREEIIKPRDTGSLDSARSTEKDKNMNELDVTGIFDGLTPEQAEESSERIAATLSSLEEQVEQELESLKNQEAKEMATQYDEDDLRKLGALQARIEDLKMETEAERLAKLDEEERAELATLPRGVAGMKARSAVNSKYQELRYGKRTNGSLDWLQAQRDANQKLAIPETSDQRELMASYKKAIAPWRGQVGKVSSIQAQFRARGLKGI